MDWVVDPVALHWFNKADAQLKWLGFSVEYLSDKAPVCYYYMPIQPQYVFRLAAIKSRNKAAWSHDKRVVARLSFSPTNIPHNEESYNDLITAALGRYMINVRKEQTLYGS
jgi:hypothetical protein